MAKQKSIRRLRKPPRLPRSLRKGSFPQSLVAVWNAGLGALVSTPGNGRGGFDALVAEGRRAGADGSAAVREVLRRAYAAAAAFSERDLGDAVVAVLDGAEVPTRGEVENLHVHLRQLERRLARMTGEIVGPAAVTVVADGAAWLVRVDGDVWEVWETKRAAVSAGRRLARESGPSRLVVHRVDGTAGEATEYGEAA